MPVETWLIKLKKTIYQSFDSVHVTPPPKSSVIKRSRVGVLAFEIARIMPKLTHMWRFLSDENIEDHLHKQSVSLQGVSKIVSNKDAFLRSLACAEMIESFRVVAVSVSRLSERCDDTSLRCFGPVFDAFANTGHDPYGWSLDLKDMEAKITKMERYVITTATLRNTMAVLTIIENNLKKSLECKEVNTTKKKIILDLQQKVVWQQQQVKNAKAKSLWNRSFDSVISLLVTSIFTILSRIKRVFSIVDGYPASLPRSISASYHSNLVSGPLIKSSKHQENNEISQGFFETNSNILKPASNTLGFAGLSLHYANLIIVMEKMIRSPKLVGLDARDELYSMLPNSIKSSLRKRLKGVGFIASDRSLAEKWKGALGKILGWLSPLAHNMVKWQSERSFEHQNRMPETNVLLLQTLFYANRAKTEAAITELLVGLNYIWRFEREMMKSKALL
ncbi:hypothetical protein SSX86_032037 [Deinandra increscens subsp. villosa]|uniref:Uncharacterized protein n=1 Tax=Deinandra increscens subsp. villosa TaxID=3103831 RepID=A0AAP0C4Q9_9ASTR